MCRSRCATCAASPVYPSSASTPERQTVCSANRLSRKLRPSKAPSREQRSGFPEEAGPSPKVGPRFLGALGWQTERGASATKPTRHGASPGALGDGRALGSSPFPRGPERARGSFGPKALRVRAVTCSCARTVAMSFRGAKLRYQPEHSPFQPRPAVDRRRLLSREVREFLRLRAMLFCPCCQLLLLLQLLHWICRGNSTQGVGHDRNLSSLRQPSRGAYTAACALG